MSLCASPFELRQLIACLNTKIMALTARVKALETGTGGGGTGTGGSSNEITTPNVSAYDDARGVPGDWSFNPALDGGTFFLKVDDNPSRWVSWTVSQEI